MSNNAQRSTVIERRAHRAFRRWLEGKVDMVYFVTTEKGRRIVDEHTRYDPCDDSPHSP